MYTSFTFNCDKNKCHVFINENLLPYCCPLVMHNPKSPTIGITTGRKRNKWPLIRSDISDRYKYGVLNNGLLPIQYAIFNAKLLFLKQFLRYFRLVCYPIAAGDRWNPGNVFNRTGNNFCNILFQWTHLFSIHFYRFMGLH